IGFINANTGWLGGWYFNTYKTTDGGDTWNMDPWSYNLNRIRKISDTISYAVGRGVYKFSRDSIVGITTVNNFVPEIYLLHQNYPNPFNPVTKIKIDIPSNVKGQTSDVKLVVYVALGKEVITIMNDLLFPGSYEVEFDGSNFSSGIYLYKIQMEDFSEVKRMILLK
ncbi:MAG: T9SS type A sorting domain-containing protein, partial [Bacteroidota bacterium]|nr:T9SS type A sorting domain-containing protein [Bacteroidota bacterium]